MAVEIKINKELIDFASKLSDILFPVSLAIIVILAVMNVSEVMKHE